MPDSSWIWRKVAPAPQVTERALEDIDRQDAGIKEAVGQGDEEDLRLRISMMSQAIQRLADQVTERMASVDAETPSKPDDTSILIYRRW